MGLRPVDVGAKALFLKSKAQHEGRVRAIFKNKALAPTAIDSTQLHIHPFF